MVKHHHFYRHVYYINPEGNLNDPNGLSYIHK